MPTSSSGREAPALLQFDVPSRKDAIAPAVERILAAAVPAGLDREQGHDLAVALAEALSNAAVHGHGMDDKRLVHVSVSVTPGSCVEVEVSDSGPGFDVRSVSDPTAPGQILATNGRGIFLMRRLVNKLAYNARGNSVRLTVYSSPSSGSA